MVARLIAASIVGFCVAASFVTVEGFEMPYYIAMLGACATKIAYQQHALGCVDHDYDEHDLVDVDETSHAWAGAH